MIQADIAGLAVFAELKHEPFIAALDSLLESGNGRDTERVLETITRWADFTQKLEQFIEKREKCGTWYDVIVALTVSADNDFTRFAEKRGNLAEKKLLRALAQADLSRLKRIAEFDICAFGFNLAGLIRKAGFENEAAHIEEASRALWADEGVSQKESPLFLFFPKNAAWDREKFFSYIQEKGAGIFGKYSAFHWEKTRSIPVKNPDTIRLSGLFGYEDQRSAVIANTKRFLEGKNANNVLLYGDRGTGKSATVKAVCNEFADQGLRLIEVRKDGVQYLPNLMEEIAGRGLRFIVFIDDLSFERADDSFTALKALLEGGIEARPSNAVIYATSNRRHFVKERFSDRPSSADGDPRAFDTLQEQLSLSDRFGLTVVFTAPDQDEFLSIAEKIAEERGLLKEWSAEKRGKFRENAIRWERWFNGRSPRAAVQFVDWVSGGEDFPWE